MPQVVGIGSVELVTDDFAVARRDIRERRRKKCRTKRSALLRRQTLVVDQHSFDLVQQWIGNTEIEEPVADAGQHEVGQPNRIEDVGVDEDERDRPGSSSAQ